MDSIPRHRNILILAVVVIFFSLQFTVVSPQVIDCARLIMRVAKGIIKVYGQCSKDLMNELNSDLTEYQRRIDCAMKCVMDRIGILDEYYKVTNDTMQVFFDKYVPEDYHEIGQIMVEGCLDEYAPAMDNEDDTCLAYGDFVKCVQSVVAEVCS